MKVKDKGDFSLLHDAIHWNLWYEDSTIMGDILNGREESLI